MTDSLNIPRTKTSEREQVNSAVERVRVIDALNAKLTEIDRVWGELNTAYERGDLSLEYMARSHLLVNRAVTELVVMLMTEVLKR